MKWYFLLIVGMMIMVSSSALISVGQLNPIGVEKNSSKFEEEEIKIETDNIVFNNTINFLDINISINNLPINKVINLSVRENVYYPYFKAIIPNIIVANNLKNKDITIEYNIDFGYDVSNEINNQRKERLIPLSNGDLYFKPSFYCYFNNSDVINVSSPKILDKSLINKNKIKFLLEYNLKEDYIQNGTIITCEDPITTTNEVNITLDLRATDDSNFMGTSAIQGGCAEYSPNRGVYVVGASGILGYYNETTNITHDLRTTDIGDFIGTTSLIKATCDNLGGVYFVDDTDGTVFAYYNRTINTTISLRTNNCMTSSSRWFNDITYNNNSNKELYIGGELGHFYRYNITENCLSNLSETDVGNWMATNNEIKVKYSPSNDIVYVGTTGGEYGYYNISSNQTHDLTNSDTGDFIGFNTIRDFAPDDNGGAYISAGTGVYGYHNRTSNVTRNLLPTNGETLPAAQVRTIEYDSHNNQLYIATTGGEYFRYNITSNYSHRLTATNVGDWISTNGIYELTKSTELDDSIYVIGLQGIFGIYVYNNLSFIEPVFLLNITQPNTANPSRVVSGGNLSINLSFKNNDIDITSDVTLENVTVGGLIADILINPFACSGTPTVCTGYSIQEGCSNASCTWDAADCSGTPNACSVYNSNQEGCTNASCSFLAGGSSPDYSEGFSNTGTPPSDWATWGAESTGIFSETGDTTRCINDANDDCMCIDDNSDVITNINILSKQSDVDLSGCVNGTGYVYFGKVFETGTLETIDCINVSFSSNGGVTYTNNTRIFCDDSPAATKNISLSKQFHTANFRIRISTSAFGGTSEVGCIDGIRIGCQPIGSSCAGTPTTCNQVTNSSGCTGFACTWDVADCSGTEALCNTYPNSSRCLGAGCLLGGNNQQFGYGTTWQVNVSVPSGLIALQDLFVNVSYFGNVFNNTAIKSIRYPSLFPNISISYNYYYGLNYTCDASDDVGLSIVNISYNSSAGRGQINNSVSSDTFTYTNYFYLSEGVYNFTCIVSDSDNQTNKSSILISVSPDNYSTYLNLSFLQNLPINITTYIKKQGQNINIPSHFSGEGNRFGFKYDESNLNTSFNIYGEVFDKMIYMEIKGLDEDYKEIGQYIIGKELPTSPNVLGTIHIQGVDFSEIFSKQNNLYDEEQQPKYFNHSFIKNGNSWIVEFYNLFDLDPEFFDTTNANFSAGTLWQTNITNGGIGANVTLNYTTLRINVSSGCTECGLQSSGQRNYTMTGNFTSKEFNTTSTTSVFDKIRWDISLPNSTDIMGYVCDSGIGHCGAFLRNGSVVVDTSVTNFAQTIDYTDGTITYTIPSGWSYDDIVGFGWNDNDPRADIYVFFRNGSLAIDDSQSDLTSNIAFTSSTSSYSIPAKFNTSTIIGSWIDAINPATGSANYVMFFMNFTALIVQTTAPPLSFATYAKFTIPTGYRTFDAVGINFFNRTSDGSIYFGDKTVGVDTDVTLNSGGQTATFTDSSQTSTYPSDVNITESTNITLQTRVGNSTPITNSFSTLYIYPNGTSDVDVNNNVGQYIQYKAVFTTPDKYLTPFLENVSINYTQGGITFNNASNSGEKTDTNDFTWNYGVAPGTNTILIIGIDAVDDQSNTVVGITYNSIAMTKIRQDGTTSQTSLWYLVNPTTGINTVSVDVNGVMERILVGAISLNGVDQTNPLDAQNGTTGTASTHSTVVTTVADNAWVIDTVMRRDSVDTITVGAGQSQRWNVDGGVQNGGSHEGPKTPAGAVTMSWTAADSAAYAISAASFAPVSIVAADTTPPSGNLTTITNNSVYNATKILIGSIWDEIGDVRLYINWTLNQTELSVSTGTNFTFITNLSNGTYLVNATNTDASNNVGETPFFIFTIANNTGVELPANDCTCPSPIADWVIDDGSICTLNSICNIYPNNLFIYNGELHIEEGGYLTASICYPSPNLGKLIIKAPCNDCKVVCGG